METIILSSSLLAATTAVILTVFSFKDKLYARRKDSANSPEMVIKLLEAKVNSLQATNNQLAHALELALNNQKQDDPSSSTNQNSATKTVEYYLEGYRSAINNLLSLSKGEVPKDEVPNKE